MKKNTKRLQQVRGFYSEYGRLPSYSEMMDLFGLRSKSSIHNVVRHWVEDGWLKQDRAGKLSPTERLFGVKVLGTVEAGFPSPAEEEMTDAISLDDWLIDNKQSTFLLRVSGESMINAGIHPGDLVLVDRGKQAKHNDIVIAHVDEEFTLKRLDSRGSRVLLRAENPQFPAIEPSESLSIEGVVVGVIRKY